MQNLLHLCNMSGILNHLTLLKENQESELVVLIDPDKSEQKAIHRLVEGCLEAQISTLLIGGSYVPQGKTEQLLKWIKEVSTELSLVLFPGHPDQISSQADALLLLSLLSGRNPDYLIGHHVQSANRLRESGLDLIPTAYILIDGGKTTAVQYISNTQPIPPQEIALACSTALAGEQLGMKLVYMDAGSGALLPIPIELIEEVSKTTALPLVVGGGMRTPRELQDRAIAGAQWLVVGNALEKDPNLLKEMALAIPQRTR
jgi:putative glycerol-1-phosphate prenyltransferase